MPSSFGRSGVIGGGSGVAASTTGAGSAAAGSSHIIGSLRARGVEPTTAIGHLRRGARGRGGARLHALIRCDEAGRRAGTMLSACVPTRQKSSRQAFIVASSRSIACDRRSAM